MTLTGLVVAVFVKVTKAESARSTGRKTRSGTSGSATLRSKKRKAAPESGQGYRRQRVG